MGGYAGVAPYVAAPEDDDESFASGLSSADTRLSDAATGGASAPVQAPPASPAPAAAPSGDDSFAAIHPLQAPVYQAPDRSGLTAAQGRLSADSQPLNRADYKPTWKERLIAGLGAGMMAVGGNTDTALRAGQGVVNRRWNEAQAAQQQRISADQAQVAQERSGLQDQYRDWEGNLQAFNAKDRAQQIAAQAEARKANESARLQGIAPGTEQPDDPKNPMGSWHAVTVGGKAIALSTPPDSYLKTPAGKQAQIEANIKQWGLTGEDAKYYRVNGKLKEPSPTTNIHVPSADSEQFHAWEQGLGHKPSAQEVLDYKHGGAQSKPRIATPEQFADATRKTQAAYGKAQQEYQDELALAKTQQDRDAAAAHLKAKNDAIGRENSQVTRDLGGIPNDGSQQQAQAAPAPAPQQQPQPARPAQQAPPQSTGSPRTPAPNAAPKEATLVDHRTGQQIQAVVRDGKWVNKATGKPIG